jgi:hypothetical protein
VVGLWSWNIPCFLDWDIPFAYTNRDCTRRRYEGWHRAVLILFNYFFGDDKWFLDLIVNWFSTEWVLFNKIHNILQIWANRPFSIVKTISKILVHVGFSLQNKSKCEEEASFYLKLVMIYSARAYCYMLHAFEYYVGIEALVAFPWFMLLRHSQATMKQVVSSIH